MTICSVPRFWISIRENRLNKKRSIILVVVFDSPLSLPPGWQEGSFLFFYLLSEEREELLPVELRVVLEELLRRLSELRTPEAFLLSLLAVFTLLRLGLLSLFLILVVSIFSLLDFLPLSTLLRRVLLLRVPVLMRLLLLLLRRVVYTSSLPAGRLCELGRMFTEPKSERRLVWYDLSFRILHEPV